MPQQFNPFQELAGGLLSYQAATSPANRGGLGGFTDAWLNPQETIQRQRVSDVLAGVQPMIDQAYQAAQNGDMPTALQSSAAVTRQILEQTGDAQFANYITQNVMKPITEAYHVQRLGKLIGSINPDDPNTISPILEEVSRMSPELGLRLGEAKRTGDMSILQQELAKLGIQDKQFEQSLQPLQRENLQTNIAQSQQAISASQTAQQASQFNLQQAQQNAPLERRALEAQTQYHEANMPTANVIDPTTGQPTIVTPRRAVESGMQPIPRASSAAKPRVATATDRTEIENSIAVLNQELQTGVEDPGITGRVQALKQFANERGLDIEVMNWKGKPYLKQVPKPDASLNLKGSGKPRWSFD